MNSTCTRTDVWQAVQLITVLGVHEHKIQLYNGQYLYQDVNCTVPVAAQNQYCTCNRCAAVLTLLVTSVLDLQFMYLEC